MTTQFVGVYVTKRLKDKLRAEAQRRGLSLSRLARKILADLLASRLKIA